MLHILTHGLLAGTALLASTDAPVQALDTRPPSATLIDGPEVRVALEDDSAAGVPIVELRINGEGPFRFVVSTGSTVSIIDEALLALLELEPVLAPDTDEALGHVLLSLVELGGARFEGVPAVPFNRSLLSRDEDFDGVLGLPFFAHCLVTLDLPAQRLSLRRGALPAADGEVILAYDSTGVLPRIPLAVGELELWASFDTGSLAGLTLPGALEGVVPLQKASRVIGKARTVDSDFELRAALLDGSVTIGIHELQGPELRFNDIFPDASVGCEILRHFAITLDQKNRRLRLARAETGPIESRPRGKIGLMLERTQDTLRVKGTVPGSAAERAGVLAGDLLRSVNGKDVVVLGMAGLRKAMTTPPAMQMVLERDGKRIEVWVEIAAREQAVEASNSISWIYFDKKLDRLLGEFEVECSFRSAPGTPPRLETATAAVERVHAGRYVRERLLRQVGEVVVESETLIGYSASYERYELTSVSELEPGMSWLAGSWDPDAEELVLNETVATPGSAGLERWRYHFEDDGSLVRQVWVPDGRGDLWLQASFRYVPR